MLKNSRISLDKQECETENVKRLLKKQELKFINANVWYFDISHLFQLVNKTRDDNSGKSLSECLFKTNLLNNYLSENRMNQATISDILTEEPGSIDLNQQFEHLDSVTRFLCIQVKIYTVFNKKLSSRKIGQKSKHKVYLFMNSENEFTMLSKRNQLHLNYYVSLSAQYFKSLESSPVKCESLADNETDQSQISFKYCNQLESSFLVKNINSLIEENEYQIPSSECFNVSANPEKAKEEIEKNGGGCYPSFNFRHSEHQSLEISRNKYSV